MTMPERISENEINAQTGHTWRYEWAAKQLRADDVVLDIACGIGYGAPILAAARCLYVGVDKPHVPSPTFWEHGTFIETDIDAWEPDFGFNVAVCFETLEHVADLEHLVGILNRAQRLLLVSVPTVPTVGINPYHVRDFTVDDVPDLFPEWEVRELIVQSSEQSHVWSFVRPS